MKTCFFYQMSLPLPASSQNSSLLCSVLVIALSDRTWGLFLSKDLTRRPALPNMRFTPSLPGSWPRSQPQGSCWCRAYQSWGHKRRINTEEKALFVTAVWTIELRDRIYSIPCRASYFALGWFEDKDEWHQDDLKKRGHLSYILFKIVLVQNSYSAVRIE